MWRMRRYGHQTCRDVLWVLQSRRWRIRGSGEAKGTDHLAGSAYRFDYLVHFGTTWHQYLCRQCDNLPRFIQHVKFKTRYRRRMLKHQVFPYSSDLNLITIVHGICVCIKGKQSLCKERMTSYVCGEHQHTWTQNTLRKSYTIFTTRSAIGFTPHHVVCYVLIVLAAEKD